jgi:ribosomal-protein-alanine N-acetyltransferase
MVRFVVPNHDTAPKLCAIERAAFPSRTVHWTEQAYLLLGGPPKAVVLTDDTLSEGFLVLRFAAGEGEIVNLGVIPAARRKGIGRDLMEAGEILSSELGCERLCLEVAVNNSAAQALYAKLGYLEAGQRPGYYLQPDGTRVDALVLAKDLVAPE